MTNYDAGRRADLPLRLIARVKIMPDGCWHWLGSIAPHGYGKTWFRGRLDYAHRVFYTLFVSEIPAGMQIDHLCRNRACVNPDHMEPVTQRVNVLRGISPSAAAARKTHCPQGHPYEGDNLIIERRGSRSCRACKRAKDRRATA